jgi:hypothetical protein
VVGERWLEIGALVLGAIALALSFVALRRGVRLARSLSDLRAVIVSTQRLNALAAATESPSRPPMPTRESDGSAALTGPESSSVWRVGARPEVMTASPPREKPVAPTFQAPSRFEPNERADLGPRLGRVPTPASTIRVPAPSTPTPPQKDEASELDRPPSDPSAAIRSAAPAWHGDGPATKRRLLTALSDSHDSVRAEALRGLGSTGEVVARHAIMDVMVRDPSPSVRAEAVTALAALLRGQRPPLVR